MSKFVGSVNEIAVALGKSPSRTRELIKFEISSGTIRPVEGTHPVVYEALPIEPAEEIVAPDVVKKAPRKNLNPQAALNTMYQQAQEAGVTMLYHNGAWRVAGQRLTSKELAAVRDEGFPEWLKSVV